MRRGGYSWTSVDIEAYRTWLRLAFRSFPIIQRLTKALRFRRLFRSYDRSLPAMTSLIEAVNLRRRELGKSQDRYMPHAFRVTEHKLWNQVKAQLGRLCAHCLGARSLWLLLRPKDCQVFPIYGDGWRELSQV